MNAREKMKLVSLHAVAPPNEVVRVSEPIGGAMFVGTITTIAEQGYLVVQDQLNGSLECLWLENASSLCVKLKIGDAVLVSRVQNLRHGVVLGRISIYSSPTSGLLIESAESLTLQCGDASIDLRADGKVMIRGEDVLLRAKGTQRIRAGKVAIN